MSDFVTNSAICRPSDRSKPRSSVRRRRQIINRMAELLMKSAIARLIGRCSDNDQLR